MIKTQCDEYYLRDIHKHTVRLEKKVSPIFLRKLGTFHGGDILAGN